jgi:hypothetical protein
MIIRDEQLRERGLAIEIGRWYQGAVKSVLDLRPKTIIKDDNIARLLRQQNGPTFVTINEKDFWQIILPDLRFCIVCFSLPDSRASEIPQSLREVFRHPMFDTKAKRVGKVIRVIERQMTNYARNKTCIFYELWTKNLFTHWNLTKFYAF